MTMKRENFVTKANVDLIVGNCLANQAMEGMVCTPEDEAACRRIVTGETTLDQELAPILAKYTTVPIWDEDTQRYI